MSSSKVYGAPTSATEQRNHGDIPNILYIDNHSFYNEFWSCTSELTKAVRILAIGAGGGGGATTTWNPQECGGGGGGGMVVETTMPVAVGCVIECNVGEGGSGTGGEQTLVTCTGPIEWTIYAGGGGYGGVLTTTPSSDGGSGGAGMYREDSDFGFLLMAGGGGGGGPQAGQHLDMDIDTTNVDTIVSAGRSIGGHAGGVALQYKDNKPEYVNYTSMGAVGYKGMASGGGGATTYEGVMNFGNGGGGYGGRPGAEWGNNGKTPGSGGGGSCVKSGSYLPGGDGADGLITLEWYE